MEVSIDKKKIDLLCEAVSNWNHIHSKSEKGLIDEDKFHKK